MDELEIIKDSTEEGAEAPGGRQEQVEENSLGGGTCFYHPDRQGVGICMSCGKVVCADCSTRIDGINHCSLCLEALERQSRAQGTKSRGDRTSWSALALVFVLVLCSVFFLVQLYLVPW